jgi:hypothetical protein
VSNAFGHFVFLKAIKAPGSGFQPDSSAFLPIEDEWLVLRLESGKKSLTSGKRLENSSGTAEHLHFSILIGYNLGYWVD